MTFNTSEKPVTSSEIVRNNQDILTEAQMKWLLKNRSQNGLSNSGAVLKVAGKIYVIPSFFWEWFHSQKA